MAEIESEGELTRSEIAAFFREFADELDGPGRAGTARSTEPHETASDVDRERRDDPDREEGIDRTTGADPEVREDRDEGGAGHPDRMTIVVGGDSATLTLPETMEFDIEVASRSPLLSSGVTQSIEFDLEWEVEEVPDDESPEVI